MPDTAASLPDDMTSTVSGLEKSLQKTQRQIEGVNKDAEAAVKKEGEALGAQSQEIERQRAETKQFSVDHPFPKPDIKPWTEKPPAPDPLQGFGSWASAFGIIAGAITKTGIASSLNASAAAINAIRKNDLDAFDAAHNAWKENTQTAIEQAHWEAEGYKNSFDLMKTDQAAGLAQAQIVASQAHNDTMLQQFRSGNLKQAWDMTMALGNFALTGPAKMQELSDIAAQNRRLMQLNDDYLKAHPETKVIPPDIALKNRVQVQRESQVEKPLTPQQMDKLQQDIASYDQVFDDIDLVKNNLSAMSVGLGGRLGRPVESIEEILKLTDDATKSRVQAALQRIKQAYPHLMTGSTRQLTSNESTSLERVVGGDFAGATVQNVGARLDDLEDRLMTKYSVLRNQAGVGPERTPSAAGGGGSPAPDSGPQEGDTATNNATGEKMVYKGGEWVPVRASGGATGSYTPTNNGRDELRMGGR